MPAATPINTDSAWLSFGRDTAGDSEKSADTSNSSMPLTNGGNLYNGQGTMCDDTDYSQISIQLSNDKVINLKVGQELTQDDILTFINESKNERQEYKDLQAKQRRNSKLNNIAIGLSLASLAVSVGGAGYTWSQTGCEASMARADQCFMERQ